MDVSYENKTLLNDDMDLSSNGSDASPANIDSWGSLIFDNETEAYHFYARYAKSRGFGIRFAGCAKGKDKNGDTYIRYIYMECYKQGHKMVKKRTELVGKSYSKADVRTGWNANMRLKKDWEKKGYVIYEWNDDHNHEFVDLDKVHLLPTFREIKPEHKALIDVHMKYGLSIRSTYDAMLLNYGTVEDMGFTSNNLKNYASSKKRMEMFPGDVVVMIKWLREQTILTPGFFHDIQLDEHRQICSLFWADPVMISDYAKFGDFVSFDTTYRTNEKSRPLGIMVGFNHHKVTCVFGAALMYDETVKSFQWVFEAFLHCMDNKFPKTIMTDQAPALDLAIRVVFPGVFHGLCAWHIDQNAKKRLGSKDDANFLDIFNHLVKYVDTEAEFEFCWQKMLDECFNGNPTSDHTWLSFIFTFQKRWSSAWVKDHFTAGKTTTQLSEQLNAFAQQYLCPEMHIVDLMRHFQLLVDDLLYNEKTRDYYTQNTVPENNFSSSELMCQAARLFTPKVFKLIHEEFASVTGYTIKETVDFDLEVNYSLQETLNLLTGSMKLIYVQRWEKKGEPDERLVEEETVVLISESPMSFPNEFIVGRWARSFAKSPSTVSNIVDTVPITYGQRYKQIFNTVISIGSRICYSEAAFKCFFGYIKQGGLESLKLLDESVSANAPSRSDCSTSIDEVSDYEAVTFKKRQKDPIDGSELRLMSNLEKRLLKWKKELKRQMAQSS